MGSVLEDNLDGRKDEFSGGIAEVKNCDSNLGWRREDYERLEMFELSLEG